MTRLFCLISAYNEAPNLERCIHSVEQAFSGKADVSFCIVDGRYPDFPGEDEFSTDDTKEIAQRHGVYAQVFDYECEKRTAGLKLIDEQALDGDFVLVLDADETISSIIGLPQKVGYISFTRESKPITYGRCRLYRWEPGLHFKHRHYDLYRADGTLLASLEDAPDFQLVGFGIHHDLSHGPQRRDDKRLYYRALRARESHPSQPPRQRA